MFSKLFLIVVIFIVSSFVKCESDSEDCPDPESISPCHCDREGISCFSTLDETKLAQVFQAPNQYNAYRTVWITQNPIQKLTKNIFNGVRVYHFAIEENEIETIEEGAFAGSYDIVKDISLYKNKINSFPFTDLTLMPKLEKLTLSYNKLTTIPANSFSMATSLNLLDLSFNEIETLEPGAFFGMENLALVLLSNNKLTQLPPLAFGSIMAYFQVDLSNNLINNIDPSTFSNSVPDAIDFSNNQLTYLDPNVFEEFVKYYGTMMDVSDNPFTCRDCDKYKWLLSTSRDSILNFQCSSGRTLSQLNLLNIGCIF